MNQQPNSLKPTDEELEEYESRLSKARLEESKTPDHRLINGKKVIWSPQEGSQTSFLSCPIFECLFSGTRGPGKTDSLLMDYAQDVGQGYGDAWRGIIFRETYPQLADVVAKSEKWFRQIFPNAKFNKSSMSWHFPDGEVLLFRHMAKPSDYWNYHGHEYPFIGWEELTNWATDECYLSMFSCCRSSHPNVPRKVRATTNPYGSGHGWIKERFKLFGKWWQTIIQQNPTDSEGNKEPPRVAIHGHIDENKILLAADPNYKQTVIASASNPAMAEAWLNGSWDIVAGGMFDDVWKPEFNIVEPFDVPDSWSITRSFDWGSSAPFSVGWWAESDGTRLTLKNGKTISTVRGDLFRISEWYGWSGRPNKGLRMLASEIAVEMVEREELLGIRDRCIAGPADSSIFDVENGVCIADDMYDEGIDFEHADKRPGSRKQGWLQVRNMMKAAHKEEGLPREKAGLFVVGRNCEQFLRTVPGLPRLEKDLDDIDTNTEDHIADEVRYRVRFQVIVSSGRTTGHS